MGIRTLPLLTARLLEAGMKPSMPAVAVQSATLPEESRVYSTLADLAGQVARLGGSGPTMVLIGEVVAKAATTV
jgi:siroheme synthase